MITSNITVSGDQTRRPYVTGLAKTIQNHTRTKTQFMAEH